MSYLSIVKDTGNLTGTLDGVRPVINLSSNVEVISGDGSAVYSYGIVLSS